MPGIIGRGGNKTGLFCTVFPAAGEPLFGTSALTCCDGAVDAGAAAAGLGLSGIVGGPDCGSGAIGASTLARVFVSSATAAFAASRLNTPSIGDGGSQASLRWGDEAACTVGRVADVAPNGPELDDANSSAMDAPPPSAIPMMPPHTEQRALTLMPGSLLGSTRKTDRHSGQETFTCPP